MTQPKKSLEWAFEPLPWSKEGIEKTSKFKQTLKEVTCSHGIPKAMCQECQIVCVGCG
jgi:hypothetical protein